MDKACSQESDVAFKPMGYFTLRYLRVLCRSDDSAAQEWKEHGLRRQKGGLGVNSHFTTDQPYEFRQITHPL